MTEAAKIAAKILIVDDEPLNVDYLEQELEQEGYVTVAAGNGQEALEMVAAEAPDIILLDIMMPVMDGFTACRILKDDDDARLIPIIIMTALGAIEDRVKGIEAGADDFLTKPVDHRELHARIRTALKLKKTIDGRIGAAGRERDHFAKFVPQSVRRLVAANPDAPDLHKRDRDVSILFVDIVGHTALSEKFPPERLNALVERYFSAFLDRIHDSGADICETSGDGMMVMFTDPEPRRNAVVACETALALFAIADVLNRESEGDPLVFHMGINSGVASVGSTRYEGRSGSRWIFTADGLVANVASRLTAQAKADQLLLGPETVARLASRFALHHLGRKRLKNLTEAIDIYSLDRMSPVP